MADRTPFEVQRDQLVGEIGLSLEMVLQNLNKLNRGLESIVEVGNEFANVEALWSQFENVMARPGQRQDQSQGQAQTQTQTQSAEHDAGPASEHAHDADEDVHADVKAEEEYYEK